MKKNDRSAEMGALIGGLLFFPPIIPLVFTMGFLFSTNNLLFSLFPGLFPIIGSIIGAHIGGYIGKNKTSLASF